MNESEKRFRDNIESAKKMGKQFGLTLRGYGPGWSFVAPEYIVCRGRLIDLPDFFVGLLAERFGLPWIWGRNMDSHPSDQLNTYLKNKESEMDHLRKLMTEMNKYEE